MEVFEFYAPEPEPGPVSEVPQAPEGDRTEHHDLRNVLEDIRKDAWYTLYIYYIYLYIYIYVYYIYVYIYMYIIGVS